MNIRYQIACTIIPALLATAAPPSAGDEVRFRSEWVQVDVAPPAFSGSFGIVHRTLGGTGCGTQLGRFDLGSEVDLCLEGMTPGAENGTWDVTFLAIGTSRCDAPDNSVLAIFYEGYYVATVDDCLNVLPGVRHPFELTWTVDSGGSTGRFTNATGGGTISGYTLEDVFFGCNEGVVGPTGVGRRR